MITHEASIMIHPVKTKPAGKLPVKTKPTGKHPVKTKPKQNPLASTFAGGF